MVDRPADNGTTGTDVSALERRVSELERAIAEEHQNRLRTAADFENYRRRTEREAGSVRRAGRRDVFLPLLDIFDNLERALGAGSTDPVFLRGVEAIMGQFRRTVADLGAVPIPGIGTRFDPRLHEAVGTVPATSQPPDEVAAEVRRGFLLDGEVLRPAQVVVARSATDSP